MDSERELKAFPKSLEVLSYIRSRPIMSKWSRFYADDRNTKLYWKHSLNHYENLATKNLNKYVKDMDSRGAVSPHEDMGAWKVEKEGPHELIEVEQALFAVYGTTRSDMIVSLVAQIELVEAVIVPTKTNNGFSLESLILLRDIIAKDGRFKENPIWEYCRMRVQDKLEVFIVSQYNTLWEKERQQDVEEKFLDFYRMLMSNDMRRRAFD